jgi:hypothetical protein
VTPTEWDALERYVTDLKTDLLLGHWHIIIERQQPTATDEESDVNRIDAQTEIEKFGNLARLRVHENFRNGDPEVQRRTILHELLHLHLDRLFSDMLESIEKFASAQAGAAVRDLVFAQYERVTDALADGIAPKYPVIRWPDEHAAGVTDMAEGKTNRGRSDEARDPNRPIDPETGEKEGLGPREDDAAEEPVTPPVEPEPTAPDTGSTGS